MRYKMSADTSEKEKIVGGILTLTQTLWLAVGFVMIIGLFILLSKVLPPVVALALALPPGLLVAFPFAFYKKEGLALSEYIRLNHKFKKKSKILVNTLTYGKTDFLDDMKEVK